MLRTVIMLSACLLYIGTSYGQINWNIHAGGGINYFKDINFQDRRFGERFLGGPIFLAGTSVSGLLVKESMTEWELGINIVNGGYYSVWVKFDENNVSNGWDYANKVSRRDWYLQIPASLSFNFFEGTGFLIGTRMNYRFSLPQHPYVEFRRWIPAGHLGVFTEITPRIRLDLTAFIDILAREEPKPHLASHNSLNRRDMGATLNIRYTLK